MSGLILAIDQGTHSTRAILFDAQGKVVTQARRPVALHTRGQGEVEQDADEIRRSMRQVIDEVLTDPSLDGRTVSCAGLATQRSSVVAWNRDTGQVLAPLLSWQDRRGADSIDALATREGDIQERTGLRLSPHYGASKLRWLLDHVPAVAEAARENHLLMGPLASYLTYHLLREHPAVVDDANAARTLLWNLGTRDWDGELLALFGIPRAVLPSRRPIRANYGNALNGNIPLRAVNGDQTAALYALGKPESDTVLVNIGTGAFVLLPVDDPAARPAGLLAGISDSDATGGRYYLEGTVNGAGAALSWAARRYALTDLEQRLPEWLEEITAPPLFINTIGGLGAPWWIAGPKPYFETEHVAAPAAMVAVLESTLFLIQANILRLHEARPGIAGIRVSGGLSNLDTLCQKLSDLSGLPVRRPPQVEATARGIAWLAGGAQAQWPASGPVAVFKPRTNPGLQERYERFVEILRSFK